MSSLICETIECNHAGVADSTAKRYRDHLIHFAQYLASVHKSDFYKANKKQVRLFMAHLEKQGGEKPDPARLRCEWCKARRDPDGREGSGWSPSYRKSHLSALRFLYHHFRADDELPDIDPTAMESSPRVIVKRGYTPSKEDIKRLLAADSPPRACSWRIGSFTLRRAGRPTQMPAGQASISMLPSGSRRQEREGGHLPSGSATPSGLSGLSPLATLRGGTQSGDAGCLERSGDRLRTPDQQRHEDQSINGHEDCNVARHPRRSRAKECDPWQRRRRWNDVAGDSALLPPCLGDYRSQ